MARSIVGLLVGAALLLSGAPADAADASPVLSRIVKEGKLRVGLSGNQPPLNFTGKSGQTMGLEPDLARVLAKSMNVELVIVKRPFGELLDALEKGDVDMVMSGMTITPERNLRAAFVGPYFVSGKSVLAKTSKLASIDEETEINASSVKISVLAGSTSQRFVELVMPKATVLAAKDYDEGIAKLLDDEADAFIGDMPICVLSVLRHPEAKLATLTTPLTIEPIGIALPPNDAQLLNFVENTMGAIAMTGILDLLGEKWLEDGSWLRELP
jgi:ABC-type amino acid transport substrate-binding protein